MLHDCIAGVLVVAALICPALCGQAPADGEPCCPHSEPAPAAPCDGSRHDDPCQVAPCFCGGALVPPRDESADLQPLLATGLVVSEREVAVPPVLTDDVAYWPSPPLPPDARSALPLLI